MRRVPARGGGATCLIVHRNAGMGGEAWIPGTSSFAALGRRSGMTKGKKASAFSPSSSASVSMRLPRVKRHSGAAQRNPESRVVTEAEMRGARAPA
jgi:hypothetical protein